MSALREFGNLDPIDTIRRFCRMYKESVQAYRFNETRIGELEAETQDILHEVEFSEGTTPEHAAQLVDDLRAIRRERRHCKTENERLKPLVDWCERNKPVKNQIADVQGQIGSIIERQQSRRYSPRIRKGT